MLYMMLNDYKDFEGLDAVMSQRNYIYDCMDGDEVLCARMLDMESRVVMAKGGKVMEHSHPRNVLKFRDALSCRIGVIDFLVGCLADAMRYGDDRSQCYRDDDSERRTLLEERKVLEDVLYDVNGMIRGFIEERMSR